MFAYTLNTTTAHDRVDESSLISIKAMTVIKNILRVCFCLSEVMLLCNVHVKRTCKFM